MSFDAFDHDDYRELIRSWIAARPARSQSMLARRVGASRSKVGMVLAGAREIALAEVQSWAEGMDLEPEAAEYFAQLVRADSPLSLELRRQARAKARGMREVHFSERPTQEQAKLVSRWWVGPLAELARRPDFELDPEKLAAQLWPEIEVEELREGLQTLEEVGLLEQILDASVRPFTPSPELGEELSRFGTQYHHTQLEHASQALDEQSYEIRYFETATVGVREDDLPAMREAVQRVQEILDRFRAADGGDSVVQISLNMFSHTSKREPGS